MHPVAVLPFLLLGLQQPPPWMAWEGVARLLASVKVLHATHLVHYAPDEKTGKLAATGLEDVRLLIETDKVGKVPVLIVRSNSPAAAKGIGGYRDVVKKWAAEIRTTAATLEKESGPGLVTAMHSLNSSFAMLKMERESHSALWSGGSLSVLLRDADFQTYDPLHLVQLYGSPYEDTRQRIDAMWGKFADPMVQIRDRLTKVVGPYRDFEPLAAVPPADPDKAKRDYWSAVSEFSCRYYEAYVEYFDALSKKLADR
jgi:hypothetical protein